MTRWFTAIVAALLTAGAAAAALSLASEPLSGERCRLTVELPPVQVSETWIDGRLQHEFLVDDAGWIGRPGAPDLPSLQRLIELPDASGARLTLLGGASYEVAGVDAMPCQERVHTESELPLPWVQDEALYATDAFWPAVPYELGEPALLRNRRVALAAFQPVQVNPVTGVARIWTRLDFELSFEGTSRVNVRTPLPVGGTSLDRAVAERIFDPLRPAGELREAAFDRGRMPGKYLVFANTAALAVDSLQNLLEWKRRKGHEVVVVDNTDITWSASGIRARIVTEYNSANPVAYVLLVGDVDGSYAIPTDNTAYDHYYAMVDGGDILGDVAVGRLSCDNANQLSTICHKIRGYESNPYVADDGWLRRAGFTVGSSACYLSMKILSRAISAELVERRGYTQIDTAWCVGSSHVDDWFVEGLSFYTYRGWVGMESLNISTVLGLAQGPRTPVATIFTCGTGDFNSGDDFTEAFLMAGNVADEGGAVACMGFATLSTHTRYNNVVCGGYYGGLLEHDLPEVGACLLQGKYELFLTLPPGEEVYPGMLAAAGFAYWANLMGDPGTPQWAGVPGTLDVALPTSLPTGADHLDLTFTSGGLPVAEVAVCAYQPASGLQVVALTDEVGRALLPLDGLQPGQLQLTATHHRYRPVLGGATVAQAPAEATLASFSCGGDARLTAAGSESFIFTLTNSGSQALTNLDVAVSLDAGDGSASHGPLTWSSLAPGASHAFAGVTLAGAAGLVDGQAAPAWIDVDSDQGALRLLAGLSAAAPTMAQTSLAFPSGTLDPGETGAMRLGVGNAGSLTASGLEVTLVSLDEDLVTVLSGPLALGDLAPGGSTPADLTISVDATAVVGQTLPLRLEWSTAAGATGSFAVGVVVGSPGANDPTGPDAYGYFAYEDLDSEYALAPVFDWYAISTSEGGAGTQVPLSDNGNEQDDGAWIDLPFVFSYYGRAYDRVLVCSNGFVAFDESGFGEFDFRNHAFPTAMGPDAMIAPMWDDHESGGGGVWTWYDAGQGAFVVSWVNVPANTSGGPNSFQLVLYDPAVYTTLSGDGPFKFQYLDFNDNQSANADFPFCSIGFKDHTSTVGLTLRNWTTYPATMHAVADGRAIYVSTRPGDFVDNLPPNVQLHALAPVYAGEAATVEATVSDVSGVASATLVWRVVGGAWNSVAMAPAGGALYQAEIPGQPVGVTVEYYVEAVDASENANVGQSATATYAPVTLLFADGFNGASSFTHEAGGGLTDQWHLESARVHEGSQAWKFGGAGSADYSNYAGGVLTSPEIAIPAGSTQLRARWWSWLAAETSSFYPDSCYDGGYVEWSLDGGAWEQVEPTLAYGKALRGGSTLVSWFGWPRLLWSGAQDWTAAELELPDGTASLRLRFVFGTDQGTTREGWYLDDFLVVGVTPAEPLAAVDDLAVAVAGGTVQLNWTPVAGATYYRVYGGADAYGTLTLLGSTPEAQFQTPATPPRQFFRVVAVQ